MAQPGATISGLQVKPRELNNGGTSTSEVTFTSDGTVPAVTYLPPLALTGASGATTGVCTRFKVIAFGRVNTNGSYTFRPQLYYGISATVASNTLISAGIAVTSLATLTTNWRIEAECTYDGTSQRINCLTSGLLHTTTANAVATSITGVTSNNTTAQGFVVTGQFGTGDAANTCYLDGLDIVL